MELGKTYKLVKSIYPTATLIHKRILDGNIEFYVHYENFDRRLDEWISAEHIGSPLSVPEPLLIVESPKKQHELVDDSKITTRSRVSQTEYEPTQEEIYAALEEDRKQKTKVRNINSVVIGGYKIGVWYFSPFPEDYHDIDILYASNIQL